MMKQKIYDVHQLWTQFVTHKKWFLLSLIICMCIGVAYIYFVRPIFHVSGKMLIVEKKRDASAISASVLLQSQLPMGLGSNLGVNIGVENEKEILKSKLIARDVVMDLGLHTEYRLHKFLKSVLMYKLQPVNVTMSEADLQRLDEEQPMMYHQLDLKIYKDSEGFLVKGRLTENKKKYDIDEQRFKTLPATYQTPVGNLTLTENKTLTAKQQRIYKKDYRLDVSILPPMTRARKLAKHVSVSSASKKATSVVVISMRDESTLRGIEYINGLALHYNERTNSNRHEEAAKNDEFVSLRLEKIDKELGMTESELENFKRQFEITDPKVDAEEAMAKKGGYEGQLVSIGTQMLLLDYLSEYVNNPNNLFELIPVNVGVYSGDAVSMISRHNELVGSRNYLLKSLTEQSPQIKQTTDMIKELHPVIQTALERDRQSLILRRDVVKKEYDRYQGRISKVPEQERALTEVSRLRNIKQGVYLSLLQKREENAMELANTTDKGRLIDATLYNNKVKPKTMIVLLLALIMSVLIPYVLLFLRRWLRGTIGGYDDVISETSLPILGTIPAEGELTEDSFRSLRTRLLHQLKDGKKTVLITSYNSGDGKTYVASRLAKTLAYTGKQVALCDLDLRDSPVDYQTATSRDDLFKKLSLADILGKSGESLSGDFLANESVQQAIIGLKDKYDFVILDTAAMGEYDDSLEIACLADVTCLVCRCGKTPKTALDKVSELHDTGLIPSPQLILNYTPMKKKNGNLYYLSALLLPLLMTACGSSKNVAYMQNLDEFKNDQPGVLYDARIMPKDVLTITVNTVNPSAAQPFNLSVASVMTQSNSQLASQPTLQSYLVDNEGNIDFPIVGTLKVVGLTKSEAESMIKQKIQPYMAESENPIVTVRMSSFSISVLGEVNNPGNFTVSREKINVLEALARAGDLTIYGVRDKVKLIREDAMGKKQIYMLNLNDANIVNSPYYYLQQNDILYVEPNKARAQNSNIGNMTTLWLSSTGILVSIATLLVSLLK